MDDIVYRIRIQKIMESEGVPQRGPTKKYELDCTKEELDKFLSECKCEILSDNRNFGKPPFNVIMRGECGCRCKVFVTIVQRLTPTPEDRTPKTVIDRDGTVMSYDQWVSNKRSRER